jgi:hypothetical protein
MRSLRGLARSGTCGIAGASMPGSPSVFECSVISFCTCEKAEVRPCTTVSFCVAFTTPKCCVHYIKTNIAHPVSLCNRVFPKPTRKTLKRAFALFNLTLIDHERLS